MKLSLAILCALLSAAPLRGGDMEKLGMEFETAFREGHLDMLFPRTLDRERGGFLCDFNCDWKEGGPQLKTIVYQARTTWLASQACAAYPDSNVYAEAAWQGFSCLKERMWDKRNGGWWFRRARDFSCIEGPEGRFKHAYGMSFGLYACAAYFKVFKDASALGLAKEAFLWLETNGHDAKNEGYFEFFEEDGSSIASPEGLPFLKDGKDNCIGTLIGCKSMNTHIHLLESFTALYEVWPDPLVRRRLEEIRRIIMDRMFVRQGAMHMYFNPDWTPLPDGDSFGHDMETAFLLLEAASALGMEDDAQTLTKAKTLVDHAIDYGMDKENGGFYDLGGTFSTAYDKRKVWWAQAEALNALFTMAGKCPDDRRRYWSLFLAQWRFIQARIIDHARKGWVESAVENPSSDGAPKQSEWKCGYHDGRAMLNVMTGLKKMVSPKN